jgi:maltooligosyltrehalose trehalohydrolase
MRPAVWAPFADHVDLCLGDDRMAMVPDDRDWWRRDLDLAPGTDYAFALDGGPPLPDPRSRHQPSGVHGPSRVVAGFEPPAGPGFDLAGAVLYEMHIGTFSPEGTFAGAVDRLDHLVELGVDAVTVMPVNQFSGHHGWGYDGVDLYAVHDPYGGPEGLRQFIHECHHRGLGVVLDVVYNHLGPEGNYLGRFGPYFTDVYETPWGDAVNLDGPGSDEVRRFFIDNALMWLGEYGVDGLRIDAVHAFVDRSAVHFLEELAIRVAELEEATQRPLNLIAESDLNDPRLVWSRDRGGYGLDATWSDDFHHALHALLTGERDGYYADFGSIEDVATALTSVYVYDGRYSPHRRRSHGRPVEDVPGTRFLGYLQNHDQVGNRARGERIGHLIDSARLAIGAALVMTAPFVPRVFQGEEWNASTPFPFFSDHGDPAVAEAVRTGRRREFAAFGWSPDEIPDPQDPATFQSAKLDWAERDDPGHRELLGWYRSLIDLRRHAPDLTDGRLDRVDVEVHEERETLVMRRGRMVVGVNVSEHPRKLELPNHAVDLGPLSVLITELIP